MKKRFLATLLAMYMLFMVGCSDVNKFLEENGFGDSIYASMDEPKSKTDMVFVRMKNDNVDETYIKNLIESDREVGLIVEPTDYTYASLYRTVDIVKKLMEKLGIKLPVYYDINRLQENPNTHRANVLLADEFCCVLGVNEIYCGLYGTDENMVSFAKVYSEYFNLARLDSYDKMIAVSKDANEIIYDGIYNSVHIIESGKIYSTYDLYNTIVGAGLNDSNNFVDNYIHCVDADNTALNDMEEVAEAYGIKGVDIFRYNDNYNDYLDPYNLGNVELIIPNCYTGPNGEVLYYKDYNSNNFNNMIDSNYEIWADFSYNNGNINMKAVSEIVDGVILRCFSDYDEDHLCINNDNLYIEGGHLCPHADYNFLENLQKARECSIPYGVYWVTNYSNLSIETLQEEARYVIDLLKQNNCEEGTIAYWDVEPGVIKRSSIRNWRELYETTAVLFEEAGYRSGIYIHENDREYFVDKNGELPEYCWFATSAHYNTEIFTGVDGELFKYANFDLINDGVASQVTQCGILPGVSDYVDLNVAPKGTIKGKGNAYAKNKNAVG